MLLTLPDHFTGKLKPDGFDQVPRGFLGYKEYFEKKIINSPSLSKTHYFQFMLHHDFSEGQLLRRAGTPTVDMDDGRSREEQVPVAQRFDLFTPELVLPVHEKGIIQFFTRHFFQYVTAKQKEGAV